MTNTLDSIISLRCNISMQRNSIRAIKPFVERTLHCGKKSGKRRGGEEH